MPSDVVRVVKDLGFTEYEARVYLSLIYEAPL